MSCTPLKVTSKRKSRKKEFKLKKQKKAKKAPKLVVSESSLSAIQEEVVTPRFPDIKIS